MSLKVRSVRCKGAPGLGNQDLKFKSADIVLVYGENGCGKSLLCKAVCDAFAASVSRVGESSLPGEWVIEFDVGNEIGSVSIKKGQVDRLQMLKRAAQMDQKAENCVLAYGASRISGSGEMAMGLRSVHAVLHDLHLKELRNNVVIIDDFDSFLSFANKVLWFDHLRRNLGSKGCQLILTVRDEKFVEWAEELGLGSLVIVRLAGGDNVISEGLRAIRKG